MPSPKILHLVRMWPHSGNPQYGSFIQKHIDAIGREGLEQSVLVMDDLDVHQTDHGISVRSVSAPAGINGWSTKYKQIEEWIKSNGEPDIIHVHGASADTANIFLRLHMNYGHRIRRVVTEHGSHWVRGANRGARWALRMSHARTAVSPYLAGIMSKVAQTHYVPNIIDPSTEELADRQSGPRKFLNVSDWVDQTKGLTELLNAWAIHIENHPEDELTLIGDGPDRDILLPRIEKMKNVTSLGPDIPQGVYQTMMSHHVLIVNSRSETFSMVIGEALERGLVVISTPIPGPVSVYTDYPVIFRSGNTEDVQDLAQSMAQCPRGQEPVSMREFRSSFVAKQFTSIYQSLGRRRRA